MLRMCPRLPVSLATWEYIIINFEIMQLRSLIAIAYGLHGSVQGTILQNGQVRDVKLPDTKINASEHDFESFPADASELSYKGRWDSKKVSWWS